VPARDLARECLAKAAVVAGELGCPDELAKLETILEEGCGADVQRRIHRREGMDGLLSYLVRETARV
jgi:gamma-glutamyl:cysteine ligase YbdK (ATP-grasp superfamily)